MPGLTQASVLEIRAMAFTTKINHGASQQKRWGRILEHRGLMIGGSVLVLIGLIAIFAPLLSPYDPLAQNLGNRLQPPVWYEGGSWNHVLGTDALGRDYWTRLAYGTRVSLFIGLMAATMAGIIGAILGIGAGYFGGKFEAFVTFLTTLRLSLPVVLVALAVVALFGGTLTVLVIVLGLLLWDRYAVVLRTVTKQIKSQAYIAAARSEGASHRRVILSDVVPNLMNQFIVVWTLEVAHAILLEAALSFLGLGVQPPTPAWGLMVAEGKDMLFFEGWIITIPGVALFLLILSINMVGDGLRDLSAPENRN